MSFRKPFRATPPTLGAHYRAQQRRTNVSFARKVLGAAVGVGIVAGAFWVPAVRQQVAAAPVEMGIARARSPQPGDYWSGCNDARAAGTAPIYFGEPGYREGMDGDSDGVACEPYHGW